MQDLLQAIYTLCLDNSERMSRMEARLDALATADSNLRDEQVAEWRARVVKLFAGQYVTVTMMREALNTGSLSSKAIGSLMAEAGFEKKRGADSVRYWVPSSEAPAMADAPRLKPGPSIELPKAIAENVAAFVELRAAQRKKRNSMGNLINYDRDVVQFLGERYPGQRFSRAVIEEVERQFPDTFAVRGWAPPKSDL